MAEKLDINVVQLESLEIALLEVRFHHVDQFIVYDVLELVVSGIIQVEMSECIHVEIHLAVGTHSPSVELQICEA